MTQEIKSYTSYNIYYKNKQEFKKFYYIMNKITLS